MRKKIIAGMIIAFLLAVSVTNAQTDFFELVATGTPKDVQNAIKNGEDVKCQNNIGTTALMCASASNPNPEVVTILLNAGANVNAKNNKGVTVLMFATKNNPNSEIITVLLKAGADAKMKNNAGQTAFDYAKDNIALKGTGAYQKLEEATKGIIQAQQPQQRTTSIQGILSLYNWSGESAKIKIIGQKPQIVDIAKDEKVSVHIHGGPCYLLIRYGDLKGKYSYYKIDGFSIESTTTYKNTISIVLNKYFEANYTSHLISDKEYSKAKIVRNPKADSYAGVSDENDSQSLSIGKVTHDKISFFSPIKKYYDAIHTPTDEDYMVFSGVVLTRYNGQVKPVPGLSISVFPLDENNEATMTLCTGDDGSFGIRNPTTKTDINGRFKISTGGLWLYCKKVSIGLIVHNSSEKPFDVSILPISTKEMKLFEIPVESNKKEMDLGILELMIETPSLKGSDAYQNQEETAKEVSQVQQTQQNTSTTRKSESLNELSDLRSYSDTENKLSFRYPVTWKEMSPSEARNIMGASTSKYLIVVLYNPDDRTQNVNVQVLSPVSSQDLTEEAYGKFLKNLDKQLPQSYHKVSGSVGQLSNMASLEYVFDMTRPDGVNIRQKQFRTGKAGREVVFTFTTPVKVYEKNNNDCFNIIIKTLKIDEN
jgi:hypothetical protein